MATQHVRVFIHLKWWVRPFVQLAILNASMSIPVDLDRLTEIVTKHGVRYKFV